MEINMLIYREKYYTQIIVTLMESIAFDVRFLFYQGEKGGSRRPTNQI